jgi:hypothetical protein
MYDSTVHHPEEDADQMVSYCFYSDINFVGVLEK